MKDRFIKNGLFSLEYDKETLRDMVLELQEENKKQKEIIDKVIEIIKEKARNNCWIDQYESCDLIKILNGGNCNGI